jgi:hypothetical protein
MKSVSGYRALQTDRQQGRNTFNGKQVVYNVCYRGFKNLCIPAFADVPFCACLPLTGFCPIMLNLISRCMLAGNSLSTDSSMLSVE